MAENLPQDGGDPKTFPARPTPPDVPPPAVDQFAATIAPPDSGAAAEPDPFAATLPPAADTDPDRTDEVTLTIGGPKAQTLPDPPAPPPDVPGYDILAELGRGGMGVVYQARQTRLNRTVALKMILAGEYAGADARVRFLAEAEVVAKLQHPNIVQLYEFNVHRGVPYFSLEYVDGGGLDKLLARQPLPPAEAAALIETLARAVQYAHEQGVVHRDLKPGNILLQTRPGHGSHPPAGGPHSSHRSLHGDASFGTLSCLLREATYVPKITDFGLAKSTTGSSGLTATGAVMGTPSYMAPEQAQGNTKLVGPAADTYALGAILYECLTGRPPFQAATPIDTVVQVVREEPVPPRRLQSKVPKDLETICLKCLQKDPAKRYATTQDLAEDLRRFLTGEAIRARPVGPVERAVRWARRRPAAAALVVVLALAAAVIGVGGWVSSARLGAALAEAREQREIADRERQEADDQRAKAVAAAEEAEAHAAEADRQRQAVAANLQKRLDVVDDILFNMDARLANEPGLDSIRREFLDEVRKLSDQLLKESPDDPKVVRQAARVHQAIGDLTRQGRNYRESRAAYDRAVELFRALAERSPDGAEARADLASAVGRRATMLWYARRFKEADAEYAAAVPLYDAAAAHPGRRDMAVRAARAVYYRANALEELKKPAEAAAAYREALARQEKLVAAVPDDYDALEDLGNTAGSLALALEAQDPDEAARLLRRARDAHTQAAKLLPRSRRLRTNAADAFDDLYTFYQRRHRDADLAALADEYAKAPPGRSSGAYNAACYFALAAKAAAENPTLPAADRTTRADRYAKRAVEQLEKAVDEGFTFDDRVHMLKDADLDFLRDRADYKAFLATVEKRFPGRAVTPADLLKSLQDEFDGYQFKYERLRKTALTVADRKRAAREKPDFTAFAGRVLKLAEGNPDSPAALDALVWVVQTGATLKAGPDCCDRAMKGLKRYADRPEFANACWALGEYPTAAGDELLRAAAAGHRDRDVRGVAAYTLGLSLAKRAAEAAPGSPAQARLSAEAEERLERAAKEFGGVTYKDTTVAALAQKKLVELRSLSKGRLAREIDGEDLAGKPLKLSAYRGKVTLVFYWANWCGYCRQLFPNTRAWAEKYRGKPFAIVGVNCDDEKSAAERAVKQEKLAWPSWWDGGGRGGRITEQWQVEAFPTLYLLDADGVIREKWEGKPDPEEVQEAVEALLAKTGRTKG